jgi:isochorismate hydrolase
MKLDPRGTCLLIIDMVSDFRFEDGMAVARAAMPAARRIRPLRQRAQAAGVPSLFVNDNYGRWKSDFRELIARCTGEGCPGGPILELLAPGPRDYYVLKPSYAAFYGTPLERLLGSLGARRLILTGISAHQCVLFTANEAYLREYELFIPRDAVAAKSRRYHRLAMEYFRTVLHADTRPTGQLEFARQAKAVARRSSSARAGTAASRRA